MRIALIMTMLFLFFAVNVAFKMIDHAKHQRMIGIMPSGKTVVLNTTHRGAIDV